MIWLSLKFEFVIISLEYLKLNNFTNQITQKYLTLAYSYWNIFSLCIKLTTFCLKILTNSWYLFTTISAYLTNIG